MKYRSQDCNNNQALISARKNSVNALIYEKNQQLGIYF